MAEQEIKHAQFAYSTEFEDVDPKTGDARTRLSRRIAQRGAVVDIPREQDIERGEAFDAFVTEEEIVAREEAEAAGDEEEGEGESSAPDFSSHDSLVAWIRDTKPSASKTVAAAGDDPEKADMLLEAEEEASGGQPRSTVVNKLEKIAEP